MDTTQIIIAAIQVLPRFFPRPKPPIIDYSPLREALHNIELVPKETTSEISPIQIGVSIPARLESPTQEEQAQDVSTSCISCSRSHLSTVSGALGESLRFARESGITHPEVQRRIMLSEDEINIMERVDLAPDALARSPTEEQQLANEYLPRIRELRQNLGQITSVEKLQQTAAEASMLAQEFRLRHLQLQGVDLSPVMELAKRVQTGELTMEQAKTQLREMLPEEE